MRSDVVLLAPAGGVGVELGVAEGLFSARLLSTGHLSRLYSVDRWAGDRGHDGGEFARAAARLAGFGDRSVIYRETFAAAAARFAEGSVDFVYVDGYAHEGPAETLRMWWPKLRAGGVLAGDDYHADWPKVIEQVDAFVAEHGLVLTVLPAEAGGDSWSRYSSWAVLKSE